VDKFFFNDSEEQVPGSVWCLVKPQLADKCLPVCIGALLRYFGSIAGLAILFMWSNDQWQDLRGLPFTEQLQTRVNPQS